MNARPSITLIRLFTAHGPIHVDAAQLARRRTRLTIYTARGFRVADVGRTRDIREHAAFGVHFENLFATQELADAATDAIYRKLFGEDAQTVADLRAASAKIAAIPPSG